MFIVFKDYETKEGKMFRYSDVLWIEPYKDYLVEITLSDGTKFKSDGVRFVNQ